MGTKRKRDGTPIEHHRRVITSELDIGLLYGSICDVIRHVEALAKDDSYGYAVEYLKKALEAPPEQAAEILGASLTLTNYVLKNVAEIRSLGHEDLIRRFVDPWHIVFPSRESFESSKSPRAGQVDAGSRANINQLLAPLQDLVFHSEHRKHSQNKRIHPMARFYDIVLKHTPLATQKQRISESAWLEFLFGRIAFQEVHAVADASQPTATPDTTHAVKDMLNMLAERKMKLQIATLEQVLSQYSHILVGDHFHVDWAIVGLCFHIDPDVFVIPTISKDISDQHTRRSNQYLSSLFARINETSLSSDTMSEASRKSTLQTVLVPLVKGFTKARDLLSFIEHWRSNLILTLRLTNDSKKPSDSRHEDHEPSSVAPDSQTIWEDEDLLQEVAAQVEQRLIIGQMEAVLKDLSAAFLPANATQQAEQPQSAATNLTILDCILSGCKTENTIRQLTGVIEDLYKTLLALCEADNLPHRHSWRAWRCISTIKSRWKAELHPSLEVQEREERLAEKVLKFITHMGQSCSAEDLLQSLSFVLSVIEAPADPSQRKELASSTIQAVMEGLRQSNISFELERSKSVQFNSPIEKSLDRGVNLPHAIQYCTLQLCLRPAALQGATSELQRVFFEHLFECGLGDFAAGESTSSRLIPSSAAWQSFLNSEVLEEDNALTSVCNLTRICAWTDQGLPENFRAFQMDLLLAIQSDEPDKLSDKDRVAYALVFDSIHQAPVRAFNRKQRSKVFNRVFESLLHDKFLSLQLLRDHLKLLISYLSYPNRSMNLIRDTFNLAQDPQEAGFKKAGLFQLARSLNNRITSPPLDTEAVDLTKRFARKVLE
ncbi:MAG: hypothetical protein LQ343_001996 [Gyalolechia ehrenbergii]|nr:MAG: hypothetical protein LQ343_001996 [Gyalolechia ehrenbergii]